jgi:two-component system, chemotaxis family, CheB/CheR fusion protein
VNKKQGVKTVPSVVDSSLVKSLQVKSPRVKSPQVKPSRAKKVAQVSAGEPSIPVTPVVVGIGASAGGLEAFSKLLAALPLDTGMAFVLVQHLDPTHESLLTELLGRTTGLKVTEIVDGLSVEANHVFVIPPTANLTIRQGVLKLSPRVAGRGSHSSIDDFMASLALDLGHRAIGVVLSGTASDGTLGLEAIKAEGGITFAQDPKSARFDAMPRSAIAADVVDFVLPPEQIAAELTRLAKEPYLGQGVVAKIKGSSLAKSDTTSSESEPRESMPDPKGFERILALLHDGRGVDFSLYRASTVRRRIDRRMMLDGISSAQEYAERLRAQPQELEALYQDLLIGVTSFFRDPHAFECLQREVFPGLVKDRTADKSVRIWVSGCSTGQEAYSLAMAFLEFTAKAGINVPLQIFATDLNDATLERARAGLYANGLLQNVSKERLKRFFTEESDGHYRIRKSVRELVVFARQNVFADPPFSRLDLISCRNLLIYLDPVLQARVIPTFHHALKPGGVLLLGASETVGRFTELFATLDNRCRLYSKLAGASRIPRLDSRSSVPSAKPRVERAGAVAEASGLDTQREADRLLLSRYAPSGVVVDDALEIVQFRGATGQFLEPSTGKASFNLLRMAREGLMLPLRTLTERARQENRAVRLEAVRFLQDGHSLTINLEVVPLKRPGCLLVLFEIPVIEASTIELSEPRSEPAKTNPRDETRHIEDLTRELLEVREYLRLVQEQHEDASDQLQATNEELQSSSEEFQSLNEELETAKEELESANEEMQTLNDELTGRNAELTRLNGDLINFQASAELSTVSIGPDLHVRRFTPQAEQTLGLRVQDLGRPIGHLRHLFDPTDLPDLEALVFEVIRSGKPTDREVRDRDGRWFLLRVRPYRTLDGETDGAVLVMFGMDALKRAELERERLQHLTDAVFESLNDGLIGIDHDWTVTFINTAGLRLTRGTREEMIGKNFWTLFPETPGTLFGSNYRKAMTSRVTVDFEEFYAPLETQFEFRVVPVEAGITTFFRDVSDRRRAEVIVEETQAQLRVLAESQRRFLADAAHELRAPLAVIQGNLEVLERFPNLPADDRAEAVTDSAREAARLGRLANDLLALARGDAGDGLQLEPLELAPILEETLREAEKLAAGRHLEPGLLEPCKILGNRDKLKQLALILLDNALKYTPDGGLVTLELQRQDTHAEFRIVNTGPAISPEDLEHVFERFYRTDASRSRQTGGTGLGLPIARWIAGQHGGTVKLMSETGVGTTVIVRLPLASA